MPENSKIFTYEVDGLSYTVTVYEQDGQILADITVTEGAMDVNAIYFGDDDYSGRSESLDGPLNMNGARLDGERIQWDQATELSDPGLGPDGTDKETFLETGDTMTLELDVDSLDDIDIFGVRATSTTNDEGSIKGVSDCSEEPDPDPEEPMLEKVFFGTQTDDNGGITDGVAIVGEPQDGYANSLPEGTEPTFENYLAYYEENFDGYDVPSLETVVFYEFHEEGYPVELFRLDAPEGGFQNSEEVLAAYDEAIESAVLDGLDAPGEDGGLDLMAALNMGGEDETETCHDSTVLDDLPEDDLAMAM